MTVLGCTLLSALAQFVSPEKWTKYIRLVCGIMIIGVIASPIIEIRQADIFDFESKSELLDEFAMKKEVVEALEKRLCEDMKERVLRELSTEIEVKVKINVNENYEIEGVGETDIWTTEKREEIYRVISQEYAPQKILFHDLKN